MSHQEPRLKQSTFLCIDPKCRSDQTRVLESRATGGYSIRRRRICGVCKLRWTTVEFVVPKGQEPNHILRELQRVAMLERRIQKAQELMAAALNLRQLEQNVTAAQLEATALQVLRGQSTFTREDQPAS